MDPPKLVGPKFEARPGLRSKSVVAQPLRKIRPGMVRRAVGVFKRNAVERHGVLAVGEAAEKRLALTESDAVGIEAERARRQIHHLAKSETGDMKFLMKSLLISVLAEVASSVLPEGASCAASDTTSSTVTD